MSYAIALERLLAYEPKELGAGRYRSEEGLCCVVGAICPGSRKYGGMITVQSLSSSVLIGTGMTQNEAQALQDANDRFAGTKEERYNYVVGWLRDCIALKVYSG